MSKSMLISTWGQIFSPWLGDRVDYGIGLSNLPARLHRLAESIPRLLKILKIPSQGEASDSIEIEKLALEVGKNSPFRSRKICPFLYYMGNFSQTAHFHMFYLHFLPSVYLRAHAATEIQILEMSSSLTLMSSLPSECKLKRYISLEVLNVRSHCGR